MRIQLLGELGAGITWVRAAPDVYTDGLVSGLALGPLQSTVALRNLKVLD